MMEFILIFSTGFVSGLSPCTLPTVLFVTAYVTGNQSYSKWRGFVLSLAFVLGIAVTLSLLGLFSGMFGNLLQRTELLNYMIAAILVIMGLWLLKVFQWESDQTLSDYAPKKGSGLVGAFLLGLPFGISASPCTLPITISVLAISATKGSALYGMALMFTFALGRSIPLLLVGTFTGFLKNIQGFSKYQERIEKISGVALIVLALYFIWQA